MEMINKEDLATLSVEVPISSFRSRISTISSRPNTFQKKFMQSVKNKNTAKLQDFLQKQPELSKYTDDLGISALRECVQTGNQEILDMFLNSAECILTKLQLVDYAVLYAIEGDNIGLIRHLLKKKNEISKTLINGNERHEAVTIVNPGQNVPKTNTSFTHKLGHRTWRDRHHNLDSSLDDSAYYPVYITPILLAVRLQRHDIIALLIDFKECEIHPFTVIATECGYDSKESPECPLSFKMEKECEICYERKVFKSRRILEESRRLLEVYKTLSSPAYMFLSGTQDPILECFYLSREMEKMVIEDRAFQLEYTKIAQSCRQLTADMLDLCRSETEVKQILSRIQGVREVNSKGCATGLARVLMALNYGQKEFISHPHCQQFIEADWMKALPDWVCNTENHYLALAAYVFLWLISWPFMCVLFQLKCCPAVIRVMKYPLNKFITDTISFVIFLVLLVVNSEFQNHRRNGKPEDLFNHVEWIIIGWVIGMSIRQLKMLYRHRHSVRNFRRVYDWRLGDILFLLFFWLWIITKVVGIVYSYIMRQEDVTRNKWKSGHPLLICEAFYSIACVLSFLKLIGLFKASSALGPLQVSLKNMLMDVLRFLLIFVIVMAGFVVAIASLYSHYKDAQRVEIDSNGRNVTRTQGPELIGFQSVFRTLFWALFGYGEMDHVPDVVVDNLENLNITNNTIYNGSNIVPLPPVKHKFTEFVGYFLVGSYQIVAVIVLLNMLIAMMAKSYERIERNADMEWKFARTRLRMTYYSEVGSLPVPFNLNPLGMFTKFLVKKSKNSCDCCKKLDKYSRPPVLNDNKDTYMQLMKKLSQRYWTRERDKNTMKTKEQAEKD